MRRAITLALAAVLTATLLAAVAPGKTATAAVPAGFTDTLVTSLASPTAIAFTPDGRMLVTTQGGTLRVVENGTLVTTPALSLGTAVCTTSERGLLGVAVDPAFASNGFVYLFYTRALGGGACANRTSRFTMSGNSVVAGSEVVLIDNMPSPNGNHNAGDVAFGTDGNLYVTIGDGGCDYAGGGCAGSNDAARDQHVLTGKVLRITATGGIPAGNPFTGTNSDRCNVTGRTTAGRVCQETFAWGLRNPFRLAFDPNATDTRFFVNDVGQGAREEIDLGVAGADYGWNCMEGTRVNSTTGPCAGASGFTAPIHEYDRSVGGSITGGAFVPNDAGWPAEYTGSYLFGDFVVGSIFKLDPNGAGGYSRTTFATSLGGAVHLEFGPHATGQALYYTTYLNGGEVRRITPPSNGSPTAQMNASPTSGVAPLTVAFDGSGSSDPEGGALTYLWNFGDGASATTASPTTSHQYTGTGTFTASLRVRDPGGLESTTVTRAISVNGGNEAPTPRINAPSPTALFSVGQQVTLRGSAIDPEDGELAARNLSWQVFRHHDTHRHPWFGPVTGNGITFTAPPPEDLAATENSYLEIELTATDNAGRSTTIVQTMQPKKVRLTFATSPTGLILEIAGVQVTGPTTITSWKGWVITISAPSPQGDHVFRRWSDRRARTHNITTPGQDRTYTARFT